MGNQMQRGILGVVAALAITLVVFRASAAEAPARSEADAAYEVEDHDAEDYDVEVYDDGDELIAISYPGMGDRLLAIAERQVELVQRLPGAIASGLFVDLPRKSRAFEAAASVKDPRTIAIALTADADALGSHVSGFARGVAG